MINWYLIYAYALGVSFVLSLVLTALVRRAALRWGVLDQPGERKMHGAPVPLLGGVAIVLTFYVVILGHLLLLEPVRRLGFDWLERNVLYFLGGDVLIKLAGVFVGGAIVFVLGVVDDLKALRPEIKLVFQILAALVLVLSGVRLQAFLAWDWLAMAVTVVWVVGMMNSLNFLDNMDGLCAGISTIAALALFLCVLPHGETFVCIFLLIFAGATAGFLYHNFHPASIFMGDTGSMFCGYILATAPLLATFYTGNVPSRVAIAAPLLALSVPIFDTLSVMYIRWSHGESVMKGDKRHFSHRLVNLGMTVPQAVEFIYLVTAVTGLGAVLLSQAPLGATFLIFAQAVGVYLLIVLLMNAGNKKGSA
jgi:UDP-GlcNAc:undecaprenyl-phosphate GlcNAc-1-phosphate transferase